MRYGYFDDTLREYVITQPDTPLPWMNYLGSEAYFGIISNTAGGYSFYQDARLRRLTRYRYNNVPGDAGGRYIYLRDDDSGAFWSPSWQPVRRPLDHYSCRHGLGYTVIESEYAGIKASTRYFVPLGETLEIWQCTVSNQRDESASLSLFSFIEFCLWDAFDDMTNFQRNLSIGEVEIEDEVIYHKTEYRERRDHFAYFACSAPLAGYDTARDAFLGPQRGLQLAAGGGAGTFDELARARLGTHRLASGEAQAGAGRIAAGDLCAGLSRKSPRPEIRPAGVRRRSINGASSRSLRNTVMRQRSTWPLRRCGSIGITCSTCSRWRHPTNTPTAWSTSGTPTSAWSRSTCRVRPLAMSPASGAAWASAIRIRICSVSFTWPRIERANASWISQPHSSKTAAHITSTSP